ncbi:glutamine amidotransferase [Novipirellula artificiosorum]|uniref:Putative glutamine amidotransferase domain-containing protein n=1 Tax=Novipirellula artificiosorum TaxID=2528016 RepID=A0A5C6DWC6_9BACT|nr:glutamine amidotransferase [Novipirellula artificiosorum]TWU40968.1 hypothetical protein Poly41_18030 [Novipirellula artificiosorum]
MTSLQLEPIYDSAVVAVMASIAVVIVLILVTPPTENQIHRRWLIALRSVAALVLVLALFRPGLVRTETRAADATLVVAVDVSRSMTLPDDERADRWTHQQQAWQQLAVGLDAIRETMNVRLMGYEKNAVELAAVQDALDGIAPEGELTDLAAAATSSIALAQGQPLAGVVLMGDGTQTAPLEGPGAERVAQTLKAWGVPLWTVPIGPAGGPTANRDVAIESLPESYHLFAGNTFDVSFQVHLRGMAGMAVPVQLNWVDQDGNVTVAAQRRVIAETAKLTEGVTIPVRAPQPGTYRLNVQAETQSGETITSNNIQTAFVSVREGGGRILYVEGESLYEQRFLRMALRRFPDLDLSYQWIPRDTASRWPLPLADGFRPGKYDIYILGDVDADAIGREQLANLAESVSQGAGLVMLGGYHTYGAGGYASSPLADVIPVRLDPSLRRDIDAEVPANAADQIAGPLAAQLSRNHPITDFGGKDPASVWKRLPPLLGANRWAGPKVAPGVQVLLETTKKEPLLVIGEYGRGRTAALAFDSTWQWWREGKSEEHRRFWRQLMLWLLSREEDAGDRIDLQMDARRFAVDADIAFQATLSSVGEANTPLDWIAEVIQESGEVTPVSDVSETSTASQRSFSGKIPTLPPGYYRLRVRPTDANATIKPESLAFQVIDQSREMSSPVADPVYLRQLAEITSQHGGGAYSYEQIDELIAQITKRRRQAEAPVIEKATLGDDPLSGWLLFLLFTGALVTEWSLRRRWGLA